MTVADVSAAYKDAICALLECLEYLMWANSGRTQSPYGPHVGWILQTTYSGKVRSSIGAPVTQKTYYGWFKLLFSHDFSSITN